MTSACSPAAICASWGSSNGNRENGDSLRFRGLIPGWYSTGLRNRLAVPIFPHRTPMKFSYNWLRDLVQGLDTPPRELAQLITLKTAESEGVETHGSDHVIEIDNKSLTHRP